VPPQYPFQKSGEGQHAETRAKQKKGDKVKRTSIPSLYPLKQYEKSSD